MAAKMWVVLGALLLVALAAVAGRRLTVSAPAYASGQVCTFQPGACPHLGNDRLHNICADREPPNVVWGGKIGGPRGTLGEGCDVRYAGREMDALSWDSRMKNPRVWEVKTADWSNYKPFTKQKELEAAIGTFISHCSGVIQCNQGIRDPEYKVKYIMAIADPALYHAVNDYFVQNPGKLPPDAGDTCDTRNVQACHR